MATSNQNLSAAQFATIRHAAARPGRTLDPLPPGIKGAARQAVIDALVANGYATKCYLPTHVEYLLTDLGVSTAALTDITANVDDRCSRNIEPGV